MPAAPDWSGSDTPPSMRKVQPETHAEIDKLLLGLPDGVKDVFKIMATELIPQITHVQGAKVELRATPDQLDKLRKRIQAIVSSGLLDLTQTADEVLSRLQVAHPAPSLSEMPDPFASSK